LGELGRGGGGGPCVFRFGEKGVSTGRETARGKSQKLNPRGASEGENTIAKAPQYTQREKREGKREKDKKNQRKKRKLSKLSG